MEPRCKTSRTGLFAVVCGFRVSGDFSVSSFADSQQCFDVFNCVYLCECLGQGRPCSVRAYGMWFPFASYSLFVKFPRHRTLSFAAIQKRRCHTMRTSDGMLTIPILTTWPPKDAQQWRRARLQPMSTSNRFAPGRAPKSWYPFLSDIARLVLSVGALLDPRFDFRPRSNPAHVRRRSGANSESNVLTCWNSGHPGTNLHVELRPKRHHLTLPLFMLLVCHFCSSHKRDPNVRHDTSAFQDNCKAATTRTDNSITMLIHTFV